MQIALPSPDPTLRSSFLDRTARQRKLPRARLVRATAAVLGLLQRHASAQDLFRLRAQVPEFSLLLPLSQAPGRPRRRWLRLTPRWLEAYRSWPAPRQELPRAGGPGHREIA